MPLIDLTLQHGQTLDEARRRLEMTADRGRVKLSGVGFWVEMSVDIQAFHATGDIPMLGRLLSGPLISGLRQIVQQTFQKNLPP